MTYYQNSHPNSLDGSSATIPFGESYSSSTVTPNSNSLEMGLGWSSKSSSLKQHQLQRTRAANTLSSLSNSRGQEETGSAEASNTKKKPKTEHVGSDDKVSDRHGQTMRSQSINQASGSYSGGVPLPNTFAAADDEDDDDELGGEPTSKYNPKSTPTHSGLPIPAGEWDSGEARESASTRKQNSACDACRNRKVRCHRNPNEDKCAHCKSKGIDCTTVFVQLAITGSKRPTKRARQSTEGFQEGNALLLPPTESNTGTLIKYLISREADYPNAVRGLSYRGNHLEEVRVQPPTAAEARLSNFSARAEFVSDLIETYFSIVHTRYPILDPQEFRKRFHNPSPENGGPPAEVLVAVILAWGAKFSENPIIVADRQEAANQLTPTQRKKREAATPAKSNSHVATAAPVNGGSHHREKVMTSGRGTFRVIGRSRIAEDLVIKAQEVLDRNKVHRVSKLDNIRAALIVEALFWRPSYDSVEGRDELGTLVQFRKRRGLYVCDGAWVSSAIWHLKELRIHQQETIERINNPAQRVQVAMCWWLACQMDAHMSAFYRRKPYLAMEDYTTDLPAPPPSPEQEGPHPLASEQAYQVWLRSSQQQVEMMRMVYNALWSPRAMSDGVSARKLEQLASMAFAWRENHLSLVGAPSPTWPRHWNFADAVTACSSDMNYHIVWILMWEAIEEFGIAELKASNTSAYSQISVRHGGSPKMKSKGEMELDQSKIRGLSARIYDEALNGALRSANLSQVLCDNGYLRLEAGIMKWSMSEAGYCLTRFKRPEVTSIIEALRQYGQAFEECYDQANELEQMASVYLHNDVEPPSTMSSLYLSEDASSTTQFTPTSDLRRFTSDEIHQLHPSMQSNSPQQNIYDYYSASSTAPYGQNRGGINGAYVATYAQPTSYHQSGSGSTFASNHMPGAGMSNHPNSSFF